MNAIRILAIALIIAGAAALAYGSFSFTKETHDVSVGPIEFSMKEKETISVPTWMGIGAIALGLVLLVVRRKG